MNIATIFNVSTMTLIGFIAVEKETGTAAYLTNNKDLDECIETILNADTIDLIIPEEIDGGQLQRIEKVDTFDSRYLMAFNYYLPFPWRFLSLNYCEGDIEDALRKCYEQTIGKEQTEVAK